ncbi:4-hydroxybenzoate octaprenyltransferase [Salinimonas sp. HHU 13199]|uniref:4-hydroxybenzoate octaprenyltransferase n=1 Tax=Salinimonas profundi TaxID=2729140 RepID=A0ABR8LTX3_9ALTE|nr:4-hydroxybenzoate octaprenyltransferase [Salinimonas profundi]MBD3587615.1 4-hydroxybenzoate octaprenyltransferase [Salinimonas profundi]
MHSRLTFSNLGAYIKLTRLDKPIGIYLLLWPTLWALIIAAEGVPSLKITAIFIAGVVLMRSAGCVINDYADRKVDGAVERTKARPLVSGQASEKEALQLFALLVGISFVLVLFLNWQTIALSFVAVGLAFCYPFMKRYTHMPQAVLGAAFGWAIPMAFMAITETVPLAGWVLFVANVLWTIAYDSMYAMVDRDDDLKIGVKSSAILFGRYDKLIIGILQTLTLLLLMWVSMLIQASWVVYLALLICAGLFIYQQVQIRHRERQACFQSFLDNHYIGLAFAAGLLVHYLIIG